MRHSVAPRIDAARLLFTHHEQNERQMYIDTRFDTMQGQLDYERYLTIGCVLGHNCASCVCNGPHQRAPVTSLKDKLSSKGCIPNDVPPSVVMQFMYELWVVCGNRRLNPRG